ncbi:MAG: polysaccharide biosynthesis protein [Syntrophaceae bacterium]|nr:polysaccharide biosynthesis protein [Syntrophaceae bacterium]
MRDIIRNRNFYLMLLLDASLVTTSYLFSYILRFEGKISSQDWELLRSSLPYILVFKMIIFYLFGLYRGMWRYTSLFDLLNVLKATATSSALIILAILFIYRFQGFPRSVFIIDAILTFIAVGGIRVTVRIILSEQDKGFHPLRQIFQLPTEKRLGKPKKRLLIVGAGDAAEKIVREIRENPRLQYEVVGLLDDDPSKKSMNIHGVPVLGPVAKVHKMAYHDEMDEILIAMPSATAKQMRKVIQHCEATGLKCRTTPGIGELIDGKISFKTVREVSFEDLLGREPVDLDVESIGDYLTKKVVLVSGAGGSIGSELCRQVAGFQPRDLILLDKTENNLFHIEMEFRHRFSNLSITPVLGDVHNRGILDKFFNTVKPQVVFHAAAFKHVPIVELNPWEGVFNNVIGTKNIVEASHRSGVERFVMISTDKAVRPVSVMGATKRVAEMFTSCYAWRNSSRPDGCRFVSVRFGNVIGSEGSVIHLFKRQIERFGPVTVTHPEISRYFMTVPEACKLILQAGAMGEGGEIFVLDMGTPIKIVDMARDLIRRSGFKPDVDIEIRFIGLRPGEKLHEELITEGEGIVPSLHEKIFVLKGQNHCDLNWLNQKIEELVKLSLEQDASGIKSKLKEIIPEYEPYSR